MAKCRDCDQKILWCDILTRNGIKKLAVDPKPSDNGDLQLQRAHPDLPMIAERWKGKGPRYAAHSSSCPDIPEEDRKKYNNQDRSSSWVREQEGY